MERSKADISLIVDTNWIVQYKDRFQHPIEKAEKVVVMGNKITKIGKSINANDAYVEFIGLARFNKNEGGIIKENYHQINT